jgi:hypothetical protein
VGGQLWRRMLEVMRGYAKMRRQALSLQQVTVASLANTLQRAWEQRTEWLHLARLREPESKIGYREIRLHCSAND